MTKGETLRPRGFPIFALQPAVGQRELEPLVHHMNIRLANTYTRSYPTRARETSQDTQDTVIRRPLVLPLVVSQGTGTV
jgi:hypothetical protein